MSDEKPNSESGEQKAQSSEDEKLTKHELRELRRKESKEEREKQNSESQKFSIGKYSKYLKYVAVFIVVFAIVYVWSTSSPQGPMPSIGPVGSTHIHADLGLFLDGKEITPLPEKYFVRISEVHMEGGPGVGTVMHMHSTGVPLKMFFNSLGMSFDSKCFQFEGQRYCSDETKNLKMLVKHEGGQWEQNTDFESYVFKDLDKILITYGNETPEQIAEQQKQVTDASRLNSERKMTGF